MMNNSLTEERVLDLIDDAALGINACGGNGSRGRNGKSDRTRDRDRVRDYDKTDTGRRGIDSTSEEIVSIIGDNTDMYGNNIMFDEF